MDQRKSKRQHHRAAAAAGVCLMILLAALAISILVSKFGLAVSYYKVKTRVKEPVRVVQLTDLHESEFGRDNKRLVKKIKEQKPDLILITGDLINYSEDDVEQRPGKPDQPEDPGLKLETGLIGQLAEIAPVYISPGNQEEQLREQTGIDIASVYEEAGATVLDREYVDITVRGNQLRIGGIFGYCGWPELLKTHEAVPGEVTFLQEFEDTDREKLLLCHMPVMWKIGQSLEAYNIDTVWSGHVHGGQIIIPGVGGVYGPDFPLFPGKLDGVFPSKDGRKYLIISRGLGNRDPLPRINNVPEIMVVDLTAESSDEFR